MGKILVKGKAERQYEADLFIITLTITTNHRDSSLATKEADKMVEELLQALERLNIAAECLCITEDKTVMAAHYDDMEGYISTRRLELRAARNMSLVNDIRELIGDGFPRVAISVGYDISDESKCRKELLEEAIRDSHDRAEMMAAAVGCRIIGLDTARLDDGDFEIDELEDLTKEGNERVYMYPKDVRGMGRYADRLQTEKVELCAEVNIVWLTE